MIRRLTAKNSRYTQKGAAEPAAWLTQGRKEPHEILESHRLDFVVQRIIHLAGVDDEHSRELQVALYSGCGPQSRSYLNGLLDKEIDYVEAEAAKAAEAHASDEMLGPFYRWIVEVEQKERLMNKLRAETALACPD